MIETPQDDGGEAGTPPRPPHEMRLRASRTSVARLSRKVLLGLGAAAGLGVGAALFVALKPHPRLAGSELYNTNTHSTPDGLSALPKDYTGLPKRTPELGPPLPGDLGRPILNADAPTPGMPMSATPVDPEKQRLAEEQDAARTSHLFTTTNLGMQAAPVPAAQVSALPDNTTSTGGSAQDHKLAFLNGDVDRRTVSPDRVRAVASPFMLQAGSVIPASLITGLRSDLPGQVAAQVTDDVYDSPTGQILLVPQGARLLGQYDAQIAFGQSRALLVWTRLIMPNGRSIVLERQPGTDTEGYAGLEDGVDNHWGMLFKAAILSTILSVGAEAGTSNSENNLAQAIRQGASQSLNQAGEQVVSRSLSIQPTITIRPGFPVRVLVTHDLLLEPYSG